MDYDVTQLNDIARMVGNNAGIYVGWKLRVTATATSLVVQYDKYQPFGTPGLQMYRQAEVVVDLK